MKLLLDSFWRALAYMVMPRIIGLSMLPLLIAGGAAFALGYFFWEPAVAQVRATLDGWLLLGAALAWLDAQLGPSFRAVLGPVVVVALAAPVIVVASLLLVAALMTPSIVNLVAERRFPDLERKHGAGFFSSVLWSLGYTLAALLLLVLTLPLWLIPPLLLLIPPLIWGWLTTKVMSFDSLAEHASREERRAVLSEHNFALLLIGVVAGLLGAAPSLMWAVSAAALIFAPVLIVVSVWIYTLVFAFSALWFAHYTLAALRNHRRAAQGLPPAQPEPPEGAAPVLSPPAPQTPPPAAPPAPDPSAEAKPPLPPDLP